MNNKTAGHRGRSSGATAGEEMESARTPENSRTWLPFPAMPWTLHYEFTYRGFRISPFPIDCSVFLFCHCRKTCLVVQLHQYQTRLRLTFKLSLDQNTKLTHKIANFSNISNTKLAKDYTTTSLLASLSSIIKSVVFSPFTSFTRFHLSPAAGRSIIGHNVSPGNNTTC